jgi:hypothetical protein
MGDRKIQHPTFVNANLSVEQKGKILELLRGYVDCFTLNYTEMPSLGRDLVEHRLPIKPGFHLYKQPARNFNLTVVSKVKEDVDWLLQAKFTRPCRYADWVLNIVPIEKEGTGNIQVGVDFLNLNRATTKI